MSSCGAVVSLRRCSGLGTDPRPGVRPRALKLDYRAVDTDTCRKPLQGRGRVLAGARAHARSRVGAPTPGPAPSMARPMTTAIPRSFSGAWPKPPAAPRSSPRSTPPLGGGAGRGRLALAVRSAGGGRGVPGPEPRGRAARTRWRGRARRGSEPERAPRRALAALGLAVRSEARDRARGLRRPCGGTRVGSSP